MDSLEKKIFKKIQYKWEQNIKIKNLQNYTRQEVLNIFKKFSQQIVPIYGKQKQNFSKMMFSKDRETFILELDNQKIWVLTFKDKLQNELDIPLKYGYVEIKSLFLYDKFWEGNIWYLWEFLLKEIVKNFWKNIDGISVSVSKTKALNSYSMFKKLWFKELFHKENEYTEGNNEAHLFYFNNTSYEEI